MYKLYSRICFAPDGASGGTPTATPTATPAATPAATPEVTSDGATVETALSASDMSTAIMDAQGLDHISEESLMGIPDPADDKPADDNPADDKPADDKPVDDKPVDDKPVDDKPADDKPADDKPADDKPADDKDPERKPAASEPKDQVPPKGYVPLAAMKENRDENRFLKEQINLLNVRLDKSADKSADKPADKPADSFEVLDAETYALLAEDDPTAALVYQHDLINHNESVREQAAEAEVSAVDDFETRSIVESAFSEMQTMAPELFEEGSDAHDELVGFANDLGFDSDMFYLTNPATKIILPGETEPLLLGDQAGSILKTLLTAKTKLSDATKAADVETLTASIRKEVEAELLAKFKKEGTTFTSLQDLPASDSPKDFSSSDILSEGQLMKLTEREQEAYLSGT